MFVAVRSPFYLHNVLHLCKLFKFRFVYQIHHHKNPSYRSYDIRVYYFMMLTMIFNCLDRPIFLASTDCLDHRVCSRRYIYFLICKHNIRFVFARSTQSEELAHILRHFLQAILCLYIEKHCSSRDSPRVAPVSLRSLRKLSSTTWEYQSNLVEVVQAFAETAVRHQLHRDTFATAHKQTL